MVFFSRIFAKCSVKIEKLYEEKLNLMNILDKKTVKMAELKIKSNGAKSNKL